MKKSIIALIAVAALSSSFTVAAKDHWNMAYQQGVMEFHAVNKPTGAAITFSCKPPVEKFDPIVFNIFIDYKGKTYSGITDDGNYPVVTFEGQKYVIDDSNAGMSNWRGLFESLRDTDAKTISFQVEGKTPVFTLPVDSLKALANEYKKDECFL